MREKARQCEDRLKGLEKTLYLLRTGMAESLLIVAGAVLYGVVRLAVSLPEGGVFFGAQVVLYVLAYLLLALPSLCKLWKQLQGGFVLEENFLILVATLGAICLGKADEAMLVLLLFETVYWLQGKAVAYCRARISKAEALPVGQAVRRFRGKEVKVAPTELSIGNTIVIYPEEYVPVDARIVRGSTFLDQKALTGEAVQREAGEGDEILGGSLNVGEAVEAKVVHTYENSAVAGLLALRRSTEEACMNGKALGERFSKYYTPIAFVVAVLLAVIPPLTFSLRQWEQWIERGLVFVVASSSCGVVLSLSVAFMSGISLARRRNIFVRNGSAMETMCKGDVVVFEKTGILTTGEFQVQELHAVGRTEEEFLCMVSHIEAVSDHPISKCLRRAYPKSFDSKRVKRPLQLFGFGISATFDKKRVHLGNERFMRKKRVRCQRAEGVGTVVYVAAGGSYAGCIRVADRLRKEAVELVTRLKEGYGISVVLFTGDRKEAGEEAAEKLGIEEVYTELLPQDKLERLEELLLLENSEEKIIFVGDGGQDAPLLARADLGIAVGGLSAVGTVETADVVLLGNELTKLLEFFRLSKKTVEIVRGNIRMAMLIKAVMLSVAIAGFLTMCDVMLMNTAVVVISMINAMWIY